MVKEYFSKLSDGSWIAVWTWRRGNSETIFREYGSTKEEAEKALRNATDELYDVLEKLA